MNQIFIEKIHIDHVRHLKNIDISLSKDSMRPLIITGKNGAGKTSLLDSLSVYLNSITMDSGFDEITDDIAQRKGWLDKAYRDNDQKDITKCERMVAASEDEYEKTHAGLNVTFNIPSIEIYNAFLKGQFVVAYYKDNRVFQTEKAVNVEKVDLKNAYSITEKPSSKFVKYLVNLKFTQAIAVTENKTDKAKKIQDWFDSFEKTLQKIFDNDSLRLEFDVEHFTFSISMNGRDRFDFETLSSGFAAVLDIVVDLIMRMEKHSDRRFVYDMPGIVLIDEIETHLHLELQKSVLQILTSLFPNIQFIVTSHSPFILNSLEHAVIFDLENRTLVKDGLSDVPYQGIVRGYFNVNSLSDELKNKYEQFKKLVSKKSLSDEDYAEIARLEQYLDEIPDYLALDISTEYQDLKLRFEGRKDLQ